MELSGRIDVASGRDTRLFIYAGLSGERARGPSAFMDRGSARFDPESPITHHEFDSTHITWGAVTAGHAYTLPLRKSFAVALDGAASAYAKSERLDQAYGGHPHSLSLFAKLMLGS